MQISKRERSEERDLLRTSRYVSGSLYTLCTILLLTVMSCGFQPTQPLAVQENWTPIYFKARDALGYELQRALQTQEAHTSSKHSARTELLLNNSELEQQNLSVTSDGRNAEYLLILSVDVEWRLTESNAVANDVDSDKQKEQVQVQESNLAIMSKPFSVEASFIANPLNPGAESAEREFVTRRLEKRLVNELLRQMSLHAQRGPVEISTGGT